MTTDNINENKPYDQMTPEEKRRDLYERQKELLDTFLEHGAISKEQYEKSLCDMTEKMGFNNPNSDEDR